MIYAWCFGYIIDTYFCCCMGLNQFPAVWSWEKQILSTTVTRATYWKLVISYFSIFCNVCIFTLIYIFLFTHVNQCKSLVDCCFVQHRPVCCAVHIFAHVLMAADVMRILCCTACIPCTFCLCVHYLLVLQKITSDWRHWNSWHCVILSRALLTFCQKLKC